MAASERPHRDDWSGTAGGSTGLDRHLAAQTRTATFLGAIRGLRSDTLFVKWELQLTVPRPIDRAKREALLLAAGSVLARKGVIDTSLRTLAAEMGTSARMLVYYFGSKEQLILDVMDRQQRAAIPETDEVEKPVSVMAHRDWCFEDWYACTRGERSDTLRIVLQVFGAACGRDSPYRTYTWETLSLLTRNSQARLEALGMPSHVAATRSRIALAAFQGLIIEYFTADDHEYVDETFTRFIDEFLLATWDNANPKQTKAGGRLMEETSGKSSKG